MISNIKKSISLNNPFRLFYHQIRAILANLIYKFPSKDMVIIWVTGTNWKTTTTNLIAQSLRKSWKKVFMFSTINYMILDEIFTNTSKMTSPDPFLLQKLLSEAKELWCEYAVIETSSHSMIMHRNWWINYDIAVLTNISQDHLDLHKTMQNYIKTKLSLFKNLIRYKRKKWIKKTAIINNDCEKKDLFINQTYDSIITYWFSMESEIRAEKWNQDLEYSYFKIKIPWEILEIQTKLRWNFNIYNILAATSTLISLWINTKDISQSIKSIENIPGRLE